jgi:hypothetical protein
MNQGFSSKELIKLCRKKEWEDYGFTKETLCEKIDTNFEAIVAGVFKFDIIETGDYYRLTALDQQLIIRKLNDNIKRLYKDEQSNRRVIIKQIKALLEETTPMWVLKTDIEKFYESIDRDRMLSKLKTDAILSYNSIALLESLFANEKLSPQTGVPRGMSISATLSEMYMRKFDRWVKSFPSVYYYARFVDDIIIFSNDKRQLELLRDEINKQLEDGLRKKESKTGIYNGVNIPQTRPLEYLGYKFTTELKSTGKKKTRVLKVSIARKKIKKIKSRITHSLLDHIKSDNFDLLEKRMKFLTGNYSIKKNEESDDLKAGIFYNYCYLNHFKELHLLDLYYRKILFCKYGKLGRSLNSRLSGGQKDRLKKYSFVYGHKQKVYHSFSSDHMDEIKRCWK